MVVIQSMCMVVYCCSICIYLCVCFLLTRVIVLVNGWTSICGTVSTECPDGVQLVFGDVPSLPFGAHPPGYEEHHTKQHLLCQCVCALKVSDVANTVVLWYCTDMNFQYCISTVYLWWMKLAMYVFVILTLNLFPNFVWALFHHIIHLSTCADYFLHFPVAGKGRILLLSSVQPAHQILCQFVVPLLQSVWRSELATPTSHPYTYLCMHVQR